MEIDTAARGYSSWESSPTNKGAKPVEHAVVAIEKVQDIDSADEVRQGMNNLLGLMSDRIRIPPQATVLIKVNLCLLLGHETGATVDPYLVRCLVEWLFRHRDVKEVIIAEADATHLRADLAFTVLGWDKVFEDLPNTRFLDLSNDETVTIELNGLHFKDIVMSKAYMEADYLISFAKLKTHTIEHITLTMKNLWGALPEKVKYVYHPYLPKVICDLNAVRRPDLCLIDGLIAHEGPGPVHGSPKLMGLIVAGDDALATDIVCARLMGTSPNKAPHLALAYKIGLGSKYYQVLGRRIDEVKSSFAFRPSWRGAWVSLRSRIQKEG